MVRILLFAGLAAAAACKAQYSPADYSCTNFTVPVGVVDATTVVPGFNISDGYAATALALSLSRRGAPMSKPNTTKLTTSFDISIEYCAPNNKTASTLQLLTHGIGFDRSYWDYRPPGQPQSTEYSYVAAAMEAGYSTLAWDRLGIAPSTLANPVTEIQALVELAVLANLTALVKTGKIEQIPKPEKIIHVGHSFGSQLTHALAATSPTLSDGLVLTGFSDLADWQDTFIASTAFHIANKNQPDRFPASSYPNGYITWCDVYAYQYSFLYYPYFNVSVAEQNEATKQPFTAGEFISAPLLPPNASNFTAPVLYLEASNDLIFCGGNCTGLFNASSPAITSFSGSSSVTVYIQPNIGHAINVHYNATGAYGVITDWAKTHGF